MSLLTVTLTWDFTDALQTGESAFLQAIPTNPPWVNASGMTIVDGEPLTQDFTGGPGSLAGIIANDNAGLSPAAQGYEVTVKKADGTVLYDQTIILNHAAGASQDLSALTPAAPINPVSLELLAANNLSDVEDPATALANLGGASSAALSAETTRATTAEGVLAGGVVTNAAGVAANAAAITMATTDQALIYADDFSGTDDQKMTSALAALFAAGPLGLTGGTIMLSSRAWTFAAQWATAYTAGIATAVKIQGGGVAFNGAWGAPSAATTCAFTFAGPGPCIDMQHIGTIEIAGCQLRNANTGVPLFQATNTTPNLHDNIWSGGGSASACTTDAILLGGTGTTIGGGDTAKYNGYQGQVWNNFFDGIRRAVYFQSAANSIQVHDNTVSANCGTNLFQGACIELLGNTTKTCFGNAVYGNCIETTSYAYAVKAQFSSENQLGPNGLFDQGGKWIAGYYLGPNTSGNEVIDGCRTSAALPLALDLAGNNNRQRNMQRGAGQFDLFHAPVIFAGNAGPPQSMFFGESVIGVDTGGNQAYWRTQPGASGFPILQAAALGATQFTDGNLTAASQWVTSATAVFATADVGQVIGGTGIPSRTQVAYAVTATTAFAWQPLAAYAPGDVIRPATANTHLYQCTAAGTSASSAPAFPTGGGTVTDGTVTWTDLGTGITAALMSLAATATNTGVTIGISRPGTAVLMTGFSRHHIVSTGTAPGAVTGSASQVGAGATATVTGNDLCHILTLNTGTGSLAAGTLLTVTFGIAYTGAPKIMITPKNPATAGVPVYCTTAAATYTLATTTPLAPSTTYLFDVMTMQ